MDKINSVLNRAWKYCYDCINRAHKCQYYKYVRRALFIANSNECNFESVIDFVLNNPRLGFGVTHRQFFFLINFHSKCVI